MFTGIIETKGRISNIAKDGSNLNLTLVSDIAAQLKVDQSVSHNGICLTVVSVSDTDYAVTVIAETISKTTIGDWEVDELVNLERGMKLDARLDGHIVQGHVDQVAICTNIQEMDGSWYFSFEYDSALGNVTIEKGSVTVNGVSLTVVDSKANSFSVAIIPYTYLHTNFSKIKRGDHVNLEFDVIGKYVSRLMTR